MSAPVRVLHVAGGLKRGGIETWLMHVLRNIDRERFAMDFLVHTAEPCDYDSEAAAAGSKIIHCLHPARPFEYARNFRRLVKEHGPYDVLHAHVHRFNGYVLRLAAEAGIPKRIAHSHNDTSDAEKGMSLARQGYKWLTNRWIQSHATGGLGCSRRAAECLFGAEWERDSRWKTLLYSIDLEPFRQTHDAQELRRELGIKPGAFIIGHVGRFVPQKNHAFLLDIAEQAVRQNRNCVFLLLGEGPLRSEIEKEVLARGLANHFVIGGARADISRLMTAAMDVMVLPSLHEGLGLVLVEAQAAGLPCVFSDRIPQEAVVVAPLMRRLSLADSAAEWARAALTFFGAPMPVARTEAHSQMLRSAFNIQVGIHELEHVYLA